MKLRIIYLCIEVSDSAKREVGAAGVGIVEVDVPGRVLARKPVSLR